MVANNDNSQAAPPATRQATNSLAAFEGALGEAAEGLYILRLYVSGTTPSSLRAIDNIRRICEQYLEGRFDLEIIDIYQQPDLARDGRIVATPTLVKQLPLPLRRLIGDLSQTERILIGLDLRTKS